LRHRRQQWQQTFCWPTADSVYAQLARQPHADTDLSAAWMESAALGFAGAYNTSNFVLGMDGHDTLITFHV